MPGAGGVVCLSYSRLDAQGRAATDPTPGQGDEPGGRHQRSGRHQHRRGRSGCRHGHLPPPTAPDRPAGRSYDGVGGDQRIAVPPPLTPFPSPPRPWLLVGRSRRSGKCTRVEKRPRNPQATRETRSVDATTEQEPVRLFSGRVERSTAPAVLERVFVTYAPSRHPMTATARTCRVGRPGRSGPSAMRRFLSPRSDTPDSSTGHSFGNDDDHIPHDGDRVDVDLRSVKQRSREVQAYVTHRSDRTALGCRSPAPLLVGVAQQRHDPAAPPFRLNLLPRERRKISKLPGRVGFRTAAITESARSENSPRVRRPAAVCALRVSITRSRSA